MTNTEKQQAYRDRMVAAGYKRINIWTPRELPKPAKRMTREKFLEKFDELTEGLSKTEVQAAYEACLKVMEMNFQTRGRIAKRDKAGGKQQK
jgi:hypothetical protein